MDVLGGNPSPGLLSDAELVRVLHAAAKVAAGDADHDFVSTLYVLNTDVLGPAGERQLYELELRQVARALCEVIPADERAGVPGGEVAKVNGWLARHRGAGLRRDGAGRALMGLFTAAAERVQARLCAVNVPAEQEAAG